VKELYDACNTFDKLRIQNAESRINDEKKNKYKKYILT